MSARALALAALAVALAGCGETLVDHSGVSILADAFTCGDGQIVCGGRCVTQSVAQCGACDNACPQAPANAAEVCTAVGPGGHEGVCDFACDPGLLRCGAGCCAPALVAAGGSFSCASTTTGEVHCFGAGDAGQLGNGGVGDRATSAVLRGFSAPVTALVAGGAHACAISGGATLCWGNGAAFGASGAVLDPQAVPALAGATALSAGTSHTCGIVAGQVVCVGTDAASGGGTPSLAGGTPIAVAAGDRFSCALVSSSGAATVQCWGLDSSGQLGRGTAGTFSSTPVTVGAGVIASTVTHLAAGARHACVGAEANSGLWCWGDNGQNQLSDVASTLLGPTLSARVKKPVLALAGGDHATCALEDDASLVLTCWSKDPLVSGGSLPAGEPNHVASAPLAGPPLAFSAGGAHTCFVDAAAQPLPKLKCFGAGARGQLGNGATGASPSPVLIMDR